MSVQAYAAIDLELTGLKPGLDEIIEVGVVRCTPDDVLERWSTLVRPIEMPSLRIQRMTGITLDELARAPTWDEVSAEIGRLIGDASLLGHNLPFDLKFLEAYGLSLSGALIDTLPLAQILDPSAPSHRLSDLCARYGINLDGAHRALADAEASRRIFLHLSGRVAELTPAALTDLTQVANRGSLLWPAGRVLRELIRTSSPRHTSVNVQPAALTHQPLEPVALPSGSLAELTANAFASASSSDFEHRAEQLQMAQQVANTLQHGGALVTEAGTGTGKSLAYLVPAALWALKTANSVAISTDTINLQQQLERKDVELARQLIAGVSPEAAETLRIAVVKGRDNYLCQRKLDQELVRAGDWENPTVLARAAVWRPNSGRGDRSELRLPRSVDRLWDQLSSRGTTCLSDPSCEHTRTGSCFLLRAQRWAATSHLVIANHALLVRSLTTGAVTMPETAAVIIDEAHALEGVATNQLTSEMAETWCKEPIRAAIDGTDSLLESARAIGLIEVSQGLQQACSSAEPQIERFFDQVAKFVSENAPRNRGGEERVVLTPGARSSKSWSDLEDIWHLTQISLQEVAESVEAVQLACNRKSIDGQDDPSLFSVETNARMLVEDLRERAQQLDQTMTEHSAEEVAWISREQRRTGAARINAAPLSVAGHLQPLWHERHATVLTGATLAANSQAEDGFAFLRERLGIEDAAECAYGSPFDYERHCRIYLPTDAVDARASDHNDAVARAVFSLSDAAGGRTMVLFRSYNALEQVAKRVESRLATAGLVLNRQGRDGSADQVVDALKRDPRTVVFGVAALWTGIDVPGDALSQLIITRLPFSPPTDPVLQARGEQYENEFMEFTLPAAVLQFRQGVGRLIRTQSDTGAIVILDGRLLTSRYASRFLDALPPTPLRKLPLAEIANEVRGFLPTVQSRT